MENINQTQIDKIKAFAHPLRMQIIRYMGTNKKSDKNPVPIKELANYLNEDASKLHYHVKILEKAGLIFVADTREINGITEKYYCAAHNLDEQVQVNLKNDQEEVKAIMPMLEKNALEIIQRLQIIDKEVDGPVFGTMKQMNLSMEDAKTYAKTLSNFLDGKDAKLSLRDHGPGELEYDLILFLVPRKRAPK